MNKCCSNPKIVTFFNQCDENEPQFCENCEETFWPVNNFCDCETTSMTNMYDECICCGKPKENNANY